MDRAQSRRSLDIDLSPYLGRWIAIVRRRITGVGATATQVRLASKQQLEKEEPAIILVTEDRRRMTGKTQDPSTVLRPRSTL